MAGVQILRIGQPAAVFENLLGFSVVTLLIRPVDPFNEKHETDHRPPLPTGTAPSPQGPARVNFHHYGFDSGTSLRSQPDKKGAEDLPVASFPDP